MPLPRLLCCSADMYLPMGMHAGGQQLEERVQRGTVKAYQDNFAQHSTGLTADFYKANGMQMLRRHGMEISAHQSGESGQLLQLQCMQVLYPTDYCQKDQLLQL